VRCETCGKHVQYTGDEPDHDYHRTTGSDMSDRCAARWSELNSWRA
jgi:hypothetical protein